MIPAQLSIFPQNEYDALILRCTNQGGIDDAILAGLDIYEKRLIVKYQAEREMPILATCVTPDIRDFLKALGYRAGYTNQDGTNKYLIILDNTNHKRLMRKRTPVRAINNGPRPVGGGAMKAVGLQVKQIVEESGLTMNKFAHRYDISQPLLSDLVRGKYSMNLNTIESMFEKMGYKITGVWFERLE